MKYGYARVSSMGQDLESQIQKLENEKCDMIFQEKITGTKKERPEFNKLLQALKAGDTLVVTKMDRFARTAIHGMEIIESLFKKDISVYILNIGMVENTPTGRLILSVMLSFAQFEKDLIVERTREGKKIAKMDPDFKEGRPPKYSKKQLDHALQLKESHSYKQVEEMTGISKSTLIRAKKDKKRSLQ